MPLPRRLLLHICCGPCAIVPLRRLTEQGIEVTGLFSNPNIHPLQEYLRRRDGALEVAERFSVKLICKDADYDPAEFLRRVVFREAHRCFLCYQTRLERTASIARKGSFDAFSSTLLYSKRQNHAALAELGHQIAGNGACRFWYEDFRTGWREGIQTSQEWGIYRQSYCGCLYSEFERFQNELQSG
ncbi:epoxyqueuosine reductase QueH [Desulfohalobium retbaense]|uniref:Epoxyqueuosine reductase QueH n=1 Tax=Desulfohalobium retbaense (strain ATCC 49708 / DSM 5692 / JCM 16813 / HR100) TaxID=485915 RepID=C8X0C8_DESRD|nr:epoxyqueuosine reductase QueH [Desulfohalobium retbaense]ACV67753.1 protein of unknown function DUF208 [Desulfohalobium retbaense DSM 5692]